MEQKKIDELKKLMGFGFDIIDSIRENDFFFAHVFTEKLAVNVLIPLIAQRACAYDLTFLDEKIIESLPEPQTTKCLEDSYQEYMEYLEHGGTL